ncbi:unnamed protein product [Calypogeia fissa]
MCAMLCPNPVLYVRIVVTNLKMVGHVLHKAAAPSNRLHATQTRPDDPSLFSIRAVQHLEVMELAACPPVREPSRG